MSLIGVIPPKSGQVVLEHFRFDVRLCIDSKTIVVCSAEILRQSHNGVRTVHRILYRSQNSILDCLCDQIWGVYHFRNFSRVHIKINVLSLSSLDLFSVDFSHCVWHFLEEIWLRLINPR